MSKIIAAILTLGISLIAVAGGNPEHVQLPQDYKSEYTNYDTRTRSNGKQVAVLYANKAAIDSASDSSLAEGSTIIMEIYKKKMDENGKAMMDANGLFEKGKFAAIAVMEKRANWDAGFDAAHRSGDWGFAIYNTDGTVKENKLDCASCHVPLSSQDHLFSHSSLLDFIKK
ncbi:MAG: hypothetical protein GKR93_14465 [Gammaproteobacteria bacterium]|nr:hypothetical protein [Gammaproteobacteria bacterium]